MTTYVTAERVKETSTTTGVGPLTLLGAATGFDAFSERCADGDLTRYAIRHTTLDEWETGLGTWGTGNILTRTTPQSSTNADAAVNFSAGTKDVFIEFTAEQARMPVVYRIINRNVVLPPDCSLTFEGPVTIPAAYSLTVPPTTYVAFR